MKKLSELLSQGDMLWVLGSLCQLHRKPFDPKLVTQQFTPPYDIATLKQAARALDFETELHETSCLSADDTVFPCVAFLNQNVDSLSPSNAEEIAADKDILANTETTPETA